jgi:5-deoxy-glucuronate isomerase
VTSPLHLKPDSGPIRHFIDRGDEHGLRYVGFRLIQLPAGQTMSSLTGDSEVCLVVISGKAEIAVDGNALAEIGSRMSPFEGPPAAVYVPAGAEWSAKSTTQLEIAICSAPGRAGGHPARVIDVPAQFARGTGSNTRHVTNILPETDLGADSLLVVEVITPAGHSSSYPPHKHDTDNLPHESLLEETYYHRLNPSQGFAFQRVYTDDRSLDESMAVEDGDVVLVPRGYHPCAAVHGYDLYYLNVMAGPKRTWKFHNAVEHEWMLK